MAPRDDLPVSPPLSILGRGPASFAGRKLGVLVTSGADAEALAALREQARQHRVTLLYGAKDPSINHAVVLAGYLDGYRARKK